MDKGTRMMILCLLLAAISSPVLTGEWKANVVKDLDVLVTSCVVVPCSFTHPNEKLPSSRLRGIWHRSTFRDQSIYREDQTQILENFRGRTRLLGHLGQNNCTLEMIDMKDHDNGPFCFRIELARTEADLSTIDKFSFVEDCVTFRMLPEPPKPTLIHPKTAIQGRPYTVTCSVTHTCPSHVPKLKWSTVTTDDVVTEVQKEIRFGYWEAQSILTFTPEEKDDHTEVTCTAEFNGGSESNTVLNLYVKRTENYNHIIIPTVVAIVTAVIFGVFCVVMVKRYKGRIAELQSGDGSMWNRLSRMSRRIRSDVSRPARSDQRTNNVYSKSSADQKVSKVRFPSPKSQPKSCNYQEDLDDGDDYMNTADLNVYGNI
ncbi:myeloid cell surface antigen CD33 [Lycodopsis pacificus]